MVNVPNVLRKTQQVDSASYYNDTLKTKIWEISASFPGTFLIWFLWSKNSRRFHVLFWCNCVGRKSTWFPSTFSDVISIVEISTFFPRPFFDLTLMVQKFTLFARTFFDEILMGKNSTSFLVKLQANENIWGGFLLWVTLKRSLLQDCSP